MKKFLLALTAMAIACASLPSCGEINDSGDDIDNGGAAIYYLNYAVTEMHVIALSPLQIALRLNALLIESNGDHTNETIKNRLFGASTAISYVSETGEYFIVYNEAEVTGDIKKRGTVVVSTNGFGTLMDPNAVWNLYTNNAPQFALRWGSDDAVVEIEKSDNSYAIRNNGTGWTVNMTKFTCYPSANSTKKANWNGQYVLTPDNFSGVWDDLQAAKFSLAIGIDGSNTMHYTDVIDIESDSANPVRLTPACGGQWPAAPGGVVTTSLSEASLSASSFFIVTWLDSQSGCIPNFTIRYNGKTDTYPAMSF